MKFGTDAEAGGVEADAIVINIFVADVVNEFAIEPGEQKRRWRCWRRQRQRQRQRQRRWRWWQERRFSQGSPAFAARQLLLESFHQNARSSHGRPQTPRILRFRNPRI